MRRCLLMLALAAVCACGGGVPEVRTLAVEDATFVGRESCERCHVEETERWKGSHHDRAMELPTEEAMLGDFDGATFLSNDGVTTTFSRRGDEYWVRTDNEEGELQDYQIAYSFGFYPLQQYLIEFPDGHYQTLGVAWDSRPEEEGGQRWFHLYPDEEVPAGDRLHWTNFDQNWNYMCAECHSTDLVKNYDERTDSYATTYEEIDVSCEACHGPASVHNEWAAAKESGEQVDAGPHLGFPLALGPPEKPEWNIDPETGIAVRTPPLEKHYEVESCGRCHSRRSTMVEPYVYGRELTDTHNVSLLREGLYYPDGQILDEVYVYGSFLQSRMHAKGVECSDCHDPHGTQVYSLGNALCNRCHAAAEFDTPDHHFHETGTEGASCRACHMPETPYMVVDPRSDHSMRVPRPDLNVSLGVPDACTACHADKGAQWSADAVVRWYGPERRDSPHYGEIIAAGRRGDPSAARDLVALADDFEQSGIVRATALSMLDRYPTPDALDAIRRALSNGDPLIRTAALQAIQRTDPRLILELAYPALRDENLSVRAQAARALAQVPLDRLPPQQRDVILAAVEERIAALRTNAERFEAQINIGVLYAQIGRPRDAEVAYQRAIALAPREPGGYINLADLYRTQDRDAEGELLLREAVTIEPDNADAHYALGLLYVRRGRGAAAIQELERAYGISPDNSRYALTYALALQGRGDLASALQVLRDAHRRAPANTDILLTAVEVARGAGRLDEAREYAALLLELVPQDESIRALVRQLNEEGREGE